MSKNITPNILSLLIILLFISTIFSFFLNTYKLTNQDYTNRMISIYGDCSKEGYGFTEFINSKYKSKFNYIVLNGKPNTFVSMQNLFFNKNKSFSQKFRILINYDDELLKDFKNYKIIENKNNCYFIEIFND